jgi:hypothetical protein
LNKLEELPPLEEIKAMIEPSLVVDDNAAQTDDAVPSETPDGAAEELKEAVSVQEEAPVAEASDASATDAADDAQAETQS